MNEMSSIRDTNNKSQLCGFTTKDKMPSLSVNRELFRLSYDSARESDLDMS